MGGGGGTFIQGCGGLPEGTRPFGRSGGRWGNNIKMNLNEIGRDGN
jgi:hypothetical protein